MASRSERRAALAAQAQSPDAIVALAWSPDTDDSPTPENAPMKIRFVSVTLHKTMPRLDGGKGQATQDTTFFDVAKAGVTVELDTATQLVRIAKNHSCAYVPLSGVERFGATVEDALGFDDAKAKEAAARAAVEAAAQ
jgi:hypothetical protein